MVQSTNTQHTLSAADRIHAAINCALYNLNCAEEVAEKITATATATAPKVEEHISRARNHYKRAQEFGATKADLAPICSLWDAIKPSVEAGRTHAAAKAKKIQRALAMKGMNVREAVRLVAEEMVKAGVATDLVAAVEVLKVEVDPRTATTDLLLAAWLKLVP